MAGTGTVTGSNTYGTNDTAHSNTDMDAGTNTDTYARNSGTDTSPTGTYHATSGSTTSGSTYDNSGQLPQTGSSLPLVGLVGLLLVGLGIAVRVVRMSIS